MKIPIDFREWRGITSVPGVDEKAEAFKRSIELFYGNGVGRMDKPTGTKQTGFRIDYGSGHYLCNQCSYLTDQQHQIDEHIKRKHSDTQDYTDSLVCHYAQGFSVTKPNRDKTMLKFMVMNCGSFGNLGFRTRGEADAYLADEAPTGAVLYEKVETITVTAERKVVKTKAK